MYQGIGLPTLRELRKQHCMEVNDVAQAVKVRENTVYRWERGASAPGLLEAFAIADLFGMKVEQINWWPHGVLT